tara:strand:- start:920 stop:1186 length:267 start_codon:yes stop_codon:yes gene_type:complete
MPKTIEIPSFDTLWKIGAVVGALILGYIEFTKELDLLRMEMDDANTLIEELVEKHIEDEEGRYFEMEEQLKWYQKEFNLNPLSWKKKN